MIAAVAIFLATSVINFSQPVFDESVRWFKGNGAIAGECHCSCCKGKKCTCGMDKKKAPVSRPSKSQNKCCKDTKQSGPAEKNDVSVTGSSGFNKLQIIKNSQYPAILIMKLGASASERIIYLVSLPPGLSHSIPLRI